MGGRLASRLDVVGPVILGWVVASACAPGNGGEQPPDVGPDGPIPLVRALEIDHPDSTGSIRGASGLQFLDDERILLRDEAGRRYLVLDAEWRVVATYGAAGNGPGEFQRPVGVAILPGDSVLGVDWASGRVSVFASGGRLARTFSWAPPDMPTGGAGLARPNRSYVPLGSLSDGRIVLTAQSALAAPGERLRIFVFLAVPDAVSPTPLTDIPHLLPFAEGAARWGPVLYSSSGLLALRNDHLFIGLTDSTVIRVVDLRDGAERPIPHGLPLDPVTDAAIAAELRRRLAAPSPLPPVAVEAEAMRRAAIERTPPAPHLPAYSGMVVDPRLRVWLTRCDPLDLEACEVTVIDSRGRSLGRFPIPRGFVLHDVGERFLLGLTDDELRGRVIEVRALPSELVR